MRSEGIEWNGAAVTEAIRDAAAKGLLIGAEHLLQVSRRQVPLDEATLERSGVATVDPEKLQAAVSYDTKYAVEQHENLLFRHAPGRKAKYLEDPQNAERRTILQLVEATIRRALR